MEFQDLLYHVTVTASGGRIYRPITDPPEFCDDHGIGMHDEDMLISRKRGQSFTKLDQ
jgi:hypothetical protein